MPDESGIPEAVRQFIADHLHSIEQLEVLLFLFRVAPSACTAHQISRELRSTPSSVERRLQDLVERRLVQRAAETYRFAVEGAPAREAVRLLGETYRVRPFTVMDLLAKSRAPQMRRLAEAFRVRKDDDGHG